MWDGIPSDNDDPKPVVTNEIWSGCIRGGKDHFKVGDPWEWYITYRADPTRIDVAVCGQATPENTKHWREIRTALKQAGFKKWGWVKADKKGNLVYREWDL